MRSTADVVIVGGGVVGTSIAFHLTQLGVSDVLLLERGELSGGATGRSGALVRTHYTNAPEAQLAAAALPWFEEWADRVGGACGFVRTGFVQLVTAGDADRLRCNVAMLTGLGIDTRVLERAELDALGSGLALAAGDIGAYEPRSGHADPIATTRTLAAAAARGGARILEHTTALRLLASGGHVTGVETSAGRVQSETVILANGSWSVALVEPLGLNLPIESVGAQVAFVSRPDSLPGPAGHLTMIDRRTGIYARPNGRSETLVGLSQSARNVVSPDDTQVSASFPATALQQLALSIPAFVTQKVLRAHAGPLDVTPDHAALIGRVGGHDGLVLAVGMSGSGFKKAPAIGACVAELVVEGRARTASIDRFAPSRFAEDRPIVSNDYVVGTTAGGPGPVLVH
jgi:sarcosine oxidase subunit beta